MKHWIKIVFFLRRAFPDHCVDAGKGTGNDFIL